MIAEHGDAVEADLAFRGIDLRDLYRPQGGPSRLTPRRLLTLIKALPHGDIDPRTGVIHGRARLWAAVAAAEEKAKVPAVDKIRERQEYYRSRGH